MRDDKEKLEKILDCIDKIDEYTTDGKEAFLNDRKTQDAVVRNLQVIGEAIKDLSDDLKAKNTDVEWRKVARMRDKVTHDYFEVNYDVVWDTVESSLPPFRTSIEDIHQRLVYKVPRERDKPAILEQKLKDKDNNPRPNASK